MFMISFKVPVKVSGDCSHIHQPVFYNVVTTLSHGCGNLVDILKGCYHKQYVCEDKVLPTLDARWDR